MSYQTDNRVGEALNQDLGLEKLQKNIDVMLKRSESWHEGKNKYFFRRSLKEKYQNLLGEMN